jgi:hypothetical protein
MFRIRVKLDGRLPLILLIAWLILLAHVGHGRRSVRVDWKRKMDEIGRRRTAGWRFGVR